MNILTINLILENKGFWGFGEEQMSATVRARAELSGSASVASNNKQARQ